MTKIYLKIDKKLKRERLYIKFLFKKILSYIYVYFNIWTSLSLSRTQPIYRIFYAFCYMYNIYVA